MSVDKFDLNDDNSYRLVRETAEKLMQDSNQVEEGLIKSLARVLADSKTRLHKYKDKTLYTLTQGLISFVGEFSALWNFLLAGAVVSVVPVFYGVSDHAETVNRRDYLYGSQRLGKFMAGAHRRGMYNTNYE